MFENKSAFSNEGLPRQIEFITIDIGIVSSKYAKVLGIHTCDMHLEIRRFLFRDPPILEELSPNHRIINLDFPLTLAISTLESHL